MHQHRHIKVKAVPHDPVAMSRLIRVLIAQAAVEAAQTRLRPPTAQATTPDAVDAAGE